MKKVLKHYHVPISDEKKIKEIIFIIKEKRNYFIKDMCPTRLTRFLKG